jgi:uncharacterized flavoprotein (TIGR03862 family)
MKKTVAIVGGGPSALIAAAFLDPQLFEVTVYEKNKTLGRKFLVAGDGGFNLTHSEPIETMIGRYTPDSFLKNALLNFTNEDLRAWFAEIGIPTLVGSSKRVYPEKGIKPITVLTKIQEVLASNGVHIECEHTWEGWGTDGELVFNGDTAVKADYTLFSLGGGSWKVTGSDGSWLNTFADKGINTLPFLPANCAYQVDWSAAFIAQNEGSPLKNIALSCLKKRQTGELVITKFGLEGNAIYALSPEIQTGLAAEGSATVYLDLKPTLHLSELYERITASGLKTTEVLKRKLKLSPVQIHLLKAVLTKEEFINHDVLAEKIKALPLTVVAAAPLDEAISTTGGIPLEEVGENFELNGLKDSFCIGEMLDWNAPTGGYLLQACFSMGVFVAKHLNELD